MGSVTWQLRNGLTVVAEAGDGGTLEVPECDLPYNIRILYYTAFCYKPAIATYFYTDGTLTCTDQEGDVSVFTGQYMHKSYGNGVNPCELHNPPAPDADPAMIFFGCDYFATCFQGQGNATQSVSIIMKHSHSGGRIFDSVTSSVNIHLPEDCCGETPPPPPPPPDGSDPHITTHAVGTGVGNPMYDQATLTNVVEPAGGTITFDLYGPGDPTCTGSPVFSSTVPVSGEGLYQSATYYPTVQGIHRWVASYSGDGTNVAVATDCGDADEETDVGPTVAPGMSRREAGTGTIVWFRPEDRGQVF